MLMPATKARNHLAQIMDSAQHEPVVLIRDSEPVAVVVGVDQYRAMREALNLVQYPEVLAEIAAAREEVRRGDVEPVIEPVAVGAKA